MRSQAPLAPAKEGGILRPAVLIAAPFPAPWLSPLEAAFPEVRFYRAEDPAHLPSGAEAAQVWLGRGTRPADPWLEAAPGLRWLQATTPLTEPLKRAAASRAVWVTGLRDVGAELWAEHALTLVVAGSGGLRPYLARQPRRQWRGRVGTADLAGGRLVVWGDGVAARAIARQAAALGLEVEGVGALGQLGPIGGVRLHPPTHLEAALRGAAAVVVAPCLVQEAGAVGGSLFSLLAPGALWVHLAPRAYLDGAALTDALREGRVAAACLSVAADRSPRHARLVLRLFAQGLRRFLDGAAPLQGWAEAEPVRSSRTR